MIWVSFNYLAVIAASIASFIFGWLWYGPIFGKTWAAENKVKMQKPPMIKLLYHFLTTLLLVLCFSMLVPGTSKGYGVVLVIWAGFFLSTRLASMIWMKQSWQLFFVDITYHLLNLMLIVFVLSLF